MIGRRPGDAAYSSNKSWQHSYVSSEARSIQRLARVENQRSEIIRGKKVEVAALLLSAGAKFDMISKEDQEKILVQTICSVYHNSPLLRLLLEHGLDINLSLTEYDSLLHAAAYHNKIELVEMLLDHSASINAYNSRHGTPLATACISNQCTDEIVLRLLSRGADANAYVDDDHAPLWCAARMHKYRSIEPLLSETRARRVTQKTLKLMA